MVIAVLALVVTISGGAYAASRVVHQKLPPKSVGTRQLRKKAVTGAKIATGAVTAVKVANGSLKGEDIDLNSLGTVPAAQSAATAHEANTLDGKPAACPPNTLLVRGLCFDTTPSGPVTLPFAAADACREKGGFLPTPSELLSVRSLIDLGDGNGTHSEFTDSIWANTNGTNWRTNVVDESGLHQLELEDEKTHVKATFDYICKYPLIR
jgi:hypothetical protein